MSVTSAASMAMSVPVPIAMPTSACASAGASLMPSPTIATTGPSAWSRLISSTFCSGSTLGDHAVDAHLAGDALARCAAASPVSITTSSPMRRSRATASRGVGRTGSAIAEHAHERAHRPRRRPPSRASPAKRARFARRARDVHAMSRHAARALPTATRRPSTSPSDAASRCATRSRWPAPVACRALAPRARSRRPADARSTARRDAASASSSSSRRASRPMSR